MIGLAPIPWILACDPGTTKSACALVSPAPRGKVRIERAEWGSSAHEALCAWLADPPPGGLVLAVEKVAGYVHEHKRGKALLETQAVGMKFAGAADARGVRVEEVPASVWRKALTGNASASNPLIERWVRVFVANMPARSNEHVRDALGLAIVVSRRVWPVGR